MENPFDNILEKLARIDQKLDQLTSLQDNKRNNDCQLWGVPDAAKFLKLSARTIYAKAEKGILPASKVGRRWYFSKDELTAWAKSGNRKDNIDITAEVDHLLTAKRRRA